MDASYPTLGRPQCGSPASKLVRQGGFRHVEVSATTVASTAQLGRE